MVVSCWRLRRRELKAVVGTDQTKGTDLGGKSGRGSNLTSDGTEVDDLTGAQGARANGGRSAGCSPGDEPVPRPCPSLPVLQLLRAAPSSSPDLANETALSLKRAAPSGTPSA